MIGMSSFCGSYGLGHSLYRDERGVTKKRRLSAHRFRRFEQQSRSAYISEEYFYFCFPGGNGKKGIL